MTPEEALARFDAVVARWTPPPTPMIDALTKTGAAGYFASRETARAVWVGGDLYKSLTEELTRRDEHFQRERDPRAVPHFFGLTVISPPFFPESCFAFVDEDNKILVMVKNVGSDDGWPTRDRAAPEEEC